MYGYGSLLADRAAREACARGEVFVDLCHAKGFPTPYDTGGSVPQPQTPGATTSTPAPSPAPAPSPVITPGVKTTTPVTVPPVTVPAPAYSPMYETPITAPAMTTSGGAPWGWIVVVGAVGLGAWLLLRRRRGTSRPATSNA